MFWPELEPPVGLSRVEIRAFVGKNTDYYMRVWSTAIGAHARVRGFNRAALFLALFWLPYRKMYRVTWMYYGMIALETVIQVTLPPTGLVKRQTLWLMLRLISALMTVARGAFGNAWYLRHAQREIVRIRELISRGASG